MYTKEEIVKQARIDASQDRDIVYYLDGIENALIALLDGCDIAEGLDDTSYTWTLLSIWYNCGYIDYDLPGGSAADYCAESVQRTLSNLNIHLTNADYDIQQTLISWITDPDTLLLDPNRELELLERHGII